MVIFTQLLVHIFAIFCEHFASFIVLLIDTLALLLYQIKVRRTLLKLLIANSRDGISDFCFQESLRGSVFHVHLVPEHLCMGTGTELSLVFTH